MSGIKPHYCNHNITREKKTSINADQRAEELNLRPIMTACQSPSPAGGHPAHHYNKLHSARSSLAEAIPRTGALAMHTNAAETEGSRNSLAGHGLAQEPPARQNTVGLKEARAKPACAMLGRQTSVHISD